MKFFSDKKENKMRGERQSGFIAIIAIIVIALVTLHLFGIDLEEVLSKQSVRDFAVYVKKTSIVVWEDLKKIGSFVSDLPANDQASTTTATE